MQNSARYLIFFQYIGTNYSGVIRSPPLQPAKKGVQNYIEDAVGRLNSGNPVPLSVSSRTDSGVHALCNSAHFDLQHKDPPFTEDVLLRAINFHLGPGEIRITRVQRVPPHVHARYHAQSRTYVYRIALGVDHSSLLPLTDYRLCWGLSNKELDVKAMQEAAALLVGRHDFSSFRAISTDLPFKSPVRTLDLAHVAPGNTFVQTHFQRDIQFWELTFKSRSFLYMQVRRLTGALVAVGQGRLSVAQLREVLEAQDTRAYPQSLTPPACGLFLTRVDYNQSDLQFPEEEEERSLPPSGNPEEQY